MKKRIEKEWLDYRNDVIPKEAGLVQLQECRRAFYAGAWGLLQLILNQVEPGTEPTDADLQMMSEIRQELEEFCRAVSVDVK